MRRQIEEIPGFDPALAQAVLHIILSHHGSLEHGSPVVPATREAVLVHMIDNLGGRLGSFDRLERQLPAGESWSGFDRALSGSAYFGQRAPPSAALEAFTVQRSIRLHVAVARSGCSATSFCGLPPLCLRDVEGVADLALDLAVDVSIGLMSIVVRDFARPDSSKASLTVLIALSVVFRTGLTMKK